MNRVSASVTGLMGPGVDPHLYKAKASDVQKLQKADAVFYGGLHLEGKMQGVFDKMQGNARKTVMAVTKDIPHDRLLTPPAFAGNHDPHVWFDVALWSLCIDPVATALGQQDPAGKVVYQANATKLKKSLAALDQWAKQECAKLPKDKRVLVTSHDAFNYFGRAYDFEVVGLQGISTVTEAGLADMAKLVDFIRVRKLRAIFVESSVPHQAIEQISKETGVRIGGEIFSDAAGTLGDIENGYDKGTYEGMIRHNVSTIVGALQ
jgi:manganese/zinc/iron transport system substrate-binding protein